MDKECLVKIEDLYVDDNNILYEREEDGEWH